MNQGKFTSTHVQTLVFWERNKDSGIGKEKKEKEKERSLFYKQHCFQQIAH